MLNKDENNKKEKLKYSYNPQINSNNNPDYQVNNYIKRNSTNLEINNNENKKIRKIKFKMPQMKTKPKYQDKKADHDNIYKDIKNETNNLFKGTVIYDKSIKNFEDLEKMSETQDKLNYKKIQNNCGLDNESSTTSETKSKSKSKTSLLKYTPISEIKDKKKEKEKKVEKAEKIEKIEKNVEKVEKEQKIEKNPKNSDEKEKIIKIKIKNKRNYITNDIIYDLSFIQKNYTEKEINKIINSQIGLQNLGNTCFMNTCLQNLIHSEYFIKLLFSKKNLITEKTPITYIFFQLCLELLENKKMVISPKNLKDIFSKKHKMFKGFRQHDTQEFCRIFLEDMNQELNEIKTPEPYKELSTLNKDKLECNKEFDETFKKRENSLIMECFYSQIINIFKCECGFETYSFEKILDFPLLFRKDDDKRINLKELLDEYFKKEKIKFETKCEKCSKKEVHIKTVKISQPPNILILSLQRRHERTGKKNKAHVKFPEKLDIGDYIDKECGHKNENKYRLYGIGNHLGDMDFGHYFAYIKLNDDNWYEYNDSTVGSCLEAVKSSSSAYVLFYKKIE